MSNRIRKAVAALKKESRIIRLLPRINRVISKPSYYPELERKSRREMWLDNFKWLCRNKDINTFYTSYGLDIKDFRRPEDYLASSDFTEQRNSGNRSQIKTFYGSYNYLVLLRDKYIFSAYIASSLGEQYIPKTIGLYDGSRVFDQAAREWLDFPAFCNRSGVMVFKALNGTYGDDVFLVRMEQGNLTTGGQTLSADAFRSQLGNRKYILQDLIVQHPALQAFGTSCVNTIRTITVRGKSGAVQVFNAFLRVGTDTESFVDNRAKGGLAVGVDLETGKLMKYGFPHAQFGTKYETHPLCGIPFEGYQIPYWKEAVDMVCNAHRQFYELQSIGWDVAITEHGPVLVEGNDSWEIGGPQDTSGGLKQRWLELVNA